MKEEEKEQIKIKDVCLTLFLKPLNEFQVILWKTKQNKTHQIAEGKPP